MMAPLSTGTASVDEHVRVRRERMASVLESSARILFPTLLAGFGALYLAERETYLELLKEDGPVEWATVAFFVVAGVVGVLTWWRKGPSAQRPFYLLFSVFCLLGALEELSWLQRVMGVDTPRFFVDHSDQTDINLHNLFQGQTGIMTKLIAGVTLFTYGVLLPRVAHHPQARSLLGGRVVIPPRALTPGFLLASLLMFDRPTHDEEEIGELFGALCFALLMLIEMLRSK